MKVKITLAYDGSAFHGSQRQTQTPHTVMGVFQKALKELGISAVAIASGRTDRDVHASGQVLHVNLPPHWSDLSRLKSRLNRHLPQSVQAKRIEEVNEAFHARFSAKRRIYRYVLSDAACDPFKSRYVTYVKQLDVARLRSAITHFVGQHDFKHFMKEGAGTKSSVRDIYSAQVYTHKEFVVLRFEASGYLRSQIRLMVGFLLKISEGKLNEAQLQEQLRCKAVHSRKLAPANGLYLARIIY